MEEIALHLLRWNLLFGNVFDQLDTLATWWLCEVAQSCPTLCDPMDYSLPGSSVHGIFQAVILEWIAISFSSAWKWKVKWSHSVVSDSSWPHGLQPTRLLLPWDFPGKSTGVGCHRLLQTWALELSKWKRINIYTDSKYAYLTLHAHAAIWKESLKQQQENLLNISKRLREF